MTTIQIFILILVIHFLADFGLQTDEQAKNKSTSNKFLSYHVGTYTLVWSLVYLFLPVNEEFQNFYGWFSFSVFIFLTHFITDWVTSRIGKKFWDKGDTHFGFVVIGMDQIIHYLTLIWILLCTNLLVIKGGN